MGHLPQIQDQLLKLTQFIQFLDAIHLLQLRFIKLWQAWRDSAFLRVANCMTALKGNSNLLQIGCKNTAFNPVSIISLCLSPQRMIRTLKVPEIQPQQKSTVFKTKTQIFSSISRDSYLNHEILAEAPPWLSPFLSQSSHVIFKLA